MKFKKGDRVKLSALAIAQHIECRKKHRSGVVVGFGQGKDRPLVTRVLWDGLKCAIGYNTHFLELECAPARPSS